MPLTVNEELAAWWDEDAERLNKMAEMARKFAISLPKQKEARAFCPTGEGGGISNECGSGLGSIPKSQELSRVSSLGGSTGAILAEDDSGNRYVVKGGGAPGHIESEAAANSIYRAAGVPIPKSRLDTTDKSSPKQVSEYVKAKPLSAVRGPARDAAIEEIKKGFAIDALLANWDVVGLEQDNILVPDSGPPLRVDNGGSLTYRAMGKEKPFGPVVGELESLRTSEQGEPIFGDLTDSEVASQISELSGRKEAILAATPPKLRDVMADRIAYMEKWAKKKTRGEARGFCPTGEGGGIDNSCGTGKGVPESTESEVKPAPQSQPSDSVDSQDEVTAGVPKDLSAPSSEIESAAGPIKVIKRSDIDNSGYLDEIESHGLEIGLAVDFGDAKALQEDSDLGEDSAPFQAYVGSSSGLFTGYGDDYSELETWGAEYGVIGDYEVSELVDERLNESWDELDHEKEFAGWNDLSPEDQDEKKDEWFDENRQSVEDDIEQQRQRDMKDAVESMRSELESATARATLKCCIQLYRGLRLTPHDLEKAIKDGYLTHSGANSWTTSRDVARNFGGNNTLLVVRKPRVGHINVGDTHQEKEVIRPPSRMRIASVVKTKTGSVLYLEEDDDYKD